MIDVIKCNYFWNLHFWNSPSFRSVVVCVCVAFSCLVPYHFVVITVFLFLCDDFFSLNFRQCKHCTHTALARKTHFIYDRSSFLLFFFVFFLFFGMTVVFQFPYGWRPSTTHTRQRKFPLWEQSMWNRWFSRDCATFIRSSPFKPWA